MFDTQVQKMSEKVQRIAALEAAMLATGEPVALKEYHHFAKGTYTRELHIPAGVMLTGKIHAHSVINILAKGTIVVSDGGSDREISAPYTFVSPPGMKKAGFALTDSVWINVHPWDGEADIEQLEYQVITPAGNLIEE